MRRPRPVGHYWSWLSRWGRSGSAQEQEGGTVGCSAIGISVDDHAGLVRWGTIAPCVIMRPVNPLTSGTGSANGVKAIRVYTFDPEIADDHLLVYMQAD